MKLAQYLLGCFYILKVVVCTPQLLIVIDWPKKSLLKLAQKVSLLVPATALQELLSILPDNLETVEVYADSQQVLFKAGDVELVTRLIDATYPDYRKLIPTSFTTTATVNRDEFIAITKVSSLFARESAGSITVKVDKDDKQISITSIASQLGRKYL